MNTYFKPKTNAGVLIKNRAKQETTRFVIEPSGTGYYLVGTKKVTRKEFEKQYPVDRIGQRKNACKKGVWMDDVQAY